MKYAVRIELEYDYWFDTEEDMFQFIAMVLRYRNTLHDIVIQEHLDE